MSDMKKLLESMTKFSYAGEKVGQKPGDQVRGTDRAKSKGKDHPFKGRLVGGAAESVGEAANAAQQAAIAINMKKHHKKPKHTAETYDPEYDDEAGMADNNLETLRRAVEGLDEIIKPGDNLPEWCQEKIVTAKGMLVAVWDYMKSEQDRGAMAEAKHFRTAYGWAGGRNEKTGKTYKHPDQTKADKEAKKDKGIDRALSKLSKGPVAEGSTNLVQIQAGLLSEYKYFVQELENQTGDDDTHSPVADINPASHNQQHVMDEDDPNPAPGTQTPGQPPAQPGQQPPAGQQPGQPPTQPGQQPPAGQTQQTQAKPGQPQQQQPAKPGQPAPVNPQQVNAMTQLKTATGNAKLNPAKAAAAASVAQNNPQALNPDQKAQLQQVGQAVAPGLDNPQDIAKIKSVLPTATNPAAQPPK